MSDKLKSIDTWTLTGGGDLTGMVPEETRAFASWSIEGFEVRLKDPSGGVTDSEHIKLALINFEILHLRMLQRLLRQPAPHDTVISDAFANHLIEDTELADVLFDEEDNSILSEAVFGLECPTVERVVLFTDQLNDGKLHDVPWTWRLQLLDVVCKAMAECVLIVKTDEDNAPAFNAAGFTRVDPQLFPPDTAAGRDDDPIVWLWRGSWVRP